MIEVKITGNSIPELADKLLAMGGALRVQSVYEADNAAREAMQAERDAARPTLPQIIQAEAEKIAATKRSRKKAEAAPVTVVEDEPAAEEPVAEEAPAVDDVAVAPEGAVPTADTAMAATLKAVERVGRDKVVAILAQFGVARASEVPAAQRTEYIAMLGDA